MPLLIGTATLAATLLSMAFGQINVGFEAFGVLLAAVVLCFMLLFMGFFCFLFFVMRAVQ